MTHSPEKIAAWLRAAGKEIEDVKPIRVTSESGRKSWPGAMYVAVHKDGRKSLRLYLVGLPPAHVPAKTPGLLKQKRNTVFHLADKAHPRLLSGAPELADWYVAHYWTGAGADAANFKVHHPFGPNFGLFAWDAPGKVDQYERRPYARKNLILRRG